MGNCLEFLEKTLYVLRPPQHVPPIAALTKSGSTLEYTVFSSKVRIRATRECDITLHLKYPTTITVLGGYSNNYRICGEPEVLSKSKMIYHAGTGNSVPTNIGKIIIEGGNNLTF